MYILYVLFSDKTQRVSREILEFLKLHTTILKAFLALGVELHLRKHILFLRFRIGSIMCKAFNM